MQSNYSRNLERDNLYRNDPAKVIRPIGRFVAALSALPTDRAGTGLVELVMTGYARQSMAPGNTQWNAPADGQATNAVKIDFGALGGTTERVVGTAEFDAVTAGNLLNFSALATGWKSFAGFNTGDLIQCEAHGFVNNDRVFVRGEALPTGYNDYTEYFVISATANTFQLSTTQGGAAVAITASGGGQVGASKARDINDTDRLEFAIGALDHRRY